MLRNTLGIFLYLLLDATFAVPNLPVFLGANYVLDQHIIRAIFDSDVTYDGWTETFPCDNLFSFAGAPSSTCRWVNYREAQITMPTDGSDEVVVGDVLVLYGDILQARCPDNYPNPVECSFLPTVQAVSVVIAVQEPTLLSAVFFPDGSILRVSFDYSVTFLGWTRVFPCGYLFSYSGAISSTCQWVSDKVVDISFPSGTTSGAVLGDELGTYPGILLPKCSENYPGYEFCSFYTSLPEFTVAITVTAGSEPVVQLPAQLRVSSCVAPVIDASNSYGSGGRKWSSAAVTVSSSSSTREALELFMQENSNSFVASAPLAIPVEYIEGGYFYEIELTLCNFLGLCSSSSMKLVVESNPVPVIIIQQGSVVKIGRDEQLRLGLSYSLPFCDGTNLPSSQMGFNWTIATGGGILDVKSTTKDKTKYQIAAYSLQSGTRYSVVSTVWNKQNPSQISSVTTYVDVTEADIQAVIAGNADQMLPFDRSLSFDASGSVDNNEPADVQPTLVFQWRCATTAPTTLASCPSLVLNGAGTSVLSIDYNDNNFVAMKYEFTLLVSHPGSPYRNSTATVTATLLPPQAPEVTLRKSITTRKVNSFQPFKLTAAVSLLATENLVWSVNDSNVVLSRVLSLPATSSLLPGSYNLVGSLTLSALDRGVPYKFSVTCGTTVSSVTVLVNRPPSVGQFTVTPSSGMEITDVFTFSTSFWTDEDVPISYEFGFLTSDGSNLIVQPAARVSSTKSVLPAGAENAGYMLQCSVKAIDALGAFSSTTTSVEVLPFSGDQLAATLTNSLSEAGTLDSLKRTISISSAVLNNGNCANSPNCADLNRNPCSQVWNTCGSCISPYVGEPGSSNSPCISEADYFELDTNYEYCVVDEDCPEWKECDTESSTCVVSSKSCNWDCSGNGVCQYWSITGEPLADCKKDDFSCVASCACNSGFYGFGCSSAGDSVEEQAGVRQVILDKLGESVGLDDLSIDSSIGLISMLKAASQDSVTLTEGSSQATISIGETLMSVADELGMPIDDMFGLLESLESILLSYSPTSSGRRLGALSTETIDGILRILEEHGTTIASKWLASGSARNDAVLNQFTTSAEVFRADSSQDSTSTPSTGIGGFQSHSMTFVSEPKDMKVLTTVMQSKLYPMAADIHSNPLRLIIKATNSSSTVRFVLQHDRDVHFESFPSNITFRTKCPKHSTKIEKFTCPDDLEIVHECNGTASTLFSRCRGVKWISVCRAVDIFGALGPDVKCTAESNTDTSTTCLCQVDSGSGRRRRLQTTEDDAEDTGYLEIAAMSEQAIDEFTGTLYESQNFNSVSDVQNVITVIVMFASMWMVGLLGSYYFSLRGAMEQDNKKNMNQILKDTRLNALAKNTRTVESIKRYMNNYIDQVFPSVYGALPWYKRLVKEVLRHHRYMCLFSKDSTPKERFTTTVHLLTVQTMLMFMLAVFYDIQFPVDDGSCDNLSISSCESEKSVFDTSKSVCVWNSNQSYCEWREPYVGWEIVIIISIVVAVFTAPVNLVVDFLFNEVLTAPTADSLKLEAQDNAMKRAGRRVSSAVRRASTQATAAISSAMNSASDAMGSKNARKNVRITTTRMIPGETMSAQSLAMASTSSVVESFKQSRDSFKAHRDTLVGRNTAVANNNASIALALANANDPTISSIALFSEFERELYAQREVLRVAERPSFDDHWGISPNGQYADEPPSTLLPCSKKDAPKDIVKNEIITVQKEALEKYEKLKIATDSQIGLELLHLFVLDLLGRETPAAKIFVSKSSADFRHAMVVSKWAKRVGWFIIAVLNIFFVYFAMLRGMQRGQSWQEGYAVACAVQFAVEIFMFETTECIWMNYLIPDAASTEIQAIKFQLRRTVDSLCSASTATHKYFLDAPEYFFVSTILAKRFPDKLESMIIASYHQHLPGELAKKWKHASTNKSRMPRFLRNMSLFAITNGIMKMIGTTPPTLQRVAVHSMQPLLFAAFAIFVIFLMDNPIYAAGFALPVIYQLCVYLYNYITTGVAFPKSEDEQQVEYKRHGKSGMSGHSSSHGSMFATSGSRTPTPPSQAPAIPMMAAKPLTPPNAVMPQSMADTLLKSQGPGPALPAAPAEPSKKKGRNTVLKKGKHVKPHKEENYTAVGPMVPYPEVEAKPSSDSDTGAGQLLKLDLGKKAKKPKTDKKKKKGKGKEDQGRQAAPVGREAVEMSAKPSPGSATRRTVISFQGSSSSDLSESSEDEIFKTNESKKWEEKKS